MNVAELKAALAAFPDEASVVVRTPEADLGVQEVIPDTDKVVVVVN